MYTHSSRIKLSTVALALSAFAAPLSAQGLTGFNVFTFGSFMQTNTEVNGAIAVGGAFSNTNSSVGYTLPNGYAGNAAVIAGATNWNNGQIFHGNAVMAGSRTLNGFNIPGGVVQPQNTPLPVDFIAEKARLDALSNSYSAMLSNGSVTNNYGTLFFYGTNAGANIFNVTQAQLASANGYNFYVPNGGSMIVNVLGLGAGTLFANTGFSFCTSATGLTSFSGCSQGSNDSPPDLVNRLLWNLNTPSFVGVTSNSIRGSFLGTNIGLTATNGSCIGDFVAATINSTCEFYDETYDGYITTTSVVPEPASFALMFAGLAGVGFAVRRRGNKNA